MYATNIYGIHLFYKNRAMRLKFLSLLFFGLLISISSCNDDEMMSDIELNGEYSGTFTVKYESGEIFSEPVTVTFSANQYVSSIGPNRFPAGGNGTFEVKENSIEFKDKNIWTADFDWGLILGGTYDLKKNGVVIELYKRQNNADGYYKYELSKHNEL